MKKSDMKMGLGAAGLLAVCCAGHLLLLAIAGSGLALLTGQTALIVVALAVTITVIGFFLWQRRSRRCAVGSCPLDMSETSRQPQAAKFEQTPTFEEPKPIGAGREQR